MVFTHSETRAAVQSALKLLARQDTTTFELRSKLGSKFNQVAIEESIKFLQDTFLLDDLRLVRNHIESNFGKSAKGNTAMIHKLTSKGLDESMVQAFLDELAEPEIERAKNLVALKFGQGD
jgi:SOS response regulatory protein OraA/RecX